MNVKVLAMASPIAAFVAAAFEHSIAKMYIFRLTCRLGAPFGVADRLRNLGPVIASNIIGGSVLVALVYRVVYLPGATPQNEQP